MSNAPNVIASGSVRLKLTNRVIVSVRVNASFLTFPDRLFIVSARLETSLLTMLTSIIGLCKYPVPILSDKLIVISSFQTMISSGAPSTEVLYAPQYTYLKVSPDVPPVICACCSPSTHSVYVPVALSTYTYI